MIPLSALALVATKPITDRQPKHGVYYTMKTQRMNIARTAVTLFLSTCFAFTVATGLSACVVQTETTDDFDTPTNTVEAPGSSHHEIGMAVDIDNLVCPTYVDGSCMRTVDGSICWLHPTAAETFTELNESMVNDGNDEFGAFEYCHRDADEQQEIFDAIECEGNDNCVAVEPMVIAAKPAPKADLEVGLDHYGATFTVVNQYLDVIIKDALVGDCPVRESNSYNVCVLSLPVGTYIIKFGSVDGYESPDDVIVEVTEDGKAATYGSYAEEVTAAE